MASRLRRWLLSDRPNWPRPIRLARPWVGIAALLAAVNAFFIIIGASNPSLTGYGGTKETWIGVGVLLFSVVLFVYRRRVQDGAPVHLREPLLVEEEVGTGPPVVR